MQRNDVFGAVSMRARFGELGVGLSPSLDFLMANKACVVMSFTLLWKVYSNISQPCLLVSLSCPSRSLTLQRVRRCSNVPNHVRDQFLLESQQRADNLPVGVHMRPDFLIQNVGIVWSLKNKFNNNSHVPFQLFLIFSHSRHLIILVDTTHVFVVVMQQDWTVYFYFSMAPLLVSRVLLYMCSQVSLVFTWKQGNRPSVFPNHEQQVFKGCMKKFSAILEPFSFGNHRFR